MIWFSYVYIGERMVLMDVTVECQGARRYYLASLSEDPRICVRAHRADVALNQLVAHLQGLHEHAAVRVTFAPNAPIPCPG